MSRRAASTAPLRSARRVSVTLLALVAACGDPTGPEPVERIRELPRPLTASERTVVAGTGRFAYALLARIHEQAPDSSAFLSPLSASMALGMTALGAEGETWRQMRDMLGFDGMSHEEVGESYRSLIDLLLALDPRVELTIANALWHRDGFALETSFLDAVRSRFDARVEGLDFGDPRSVDVINAWVKEATGGKIDGIVEPPIDPLTMLFLMNAVYFKGTWTVTFDRADTRTAPFHLVDGTTTPVRLMEVTDSFRYAQGDDWVGAELPYGGGAWVMDVVVPSGERRVADLAPRLEEIVGALHDAPLTPNVEVYLPRFRLGWERTLNADLAALGMVDAFDGREADFSRMHRAAREMGLHVKEVKQKTFVEVNEEGTEAAAVTSVEVGIICACTPLVRADRPFLVVIRERLSGTILFAGAVVEAPVEG